jgi:hypothetical protein
MSTVLDALVIGIPAGIAVATVILGARQVRFLRDVTGDTSLVTTVLGFTLRPPRGSATPPRPATVDETPVRAPTKTPRISRRAA